MSGVLNLVSVGPGFADLVPPRAEEALRTSEVIVAYEPYLRWIAPWLDGKQIHTAPLTQERARAGLAIESARCGAKVALVSGGDIGVYAMAALAFEQMRDDDTFAVNVVPGITAANACASLLGAPLANDFATLSLSDIATPWEEIERRARRIAEADLACALYNVQSAGRQDGIYRIVDIMLAHKSPGTLCGVVRNAYRPDEQVGVHRLAELPSLRFDMFTTIVIGTRLTRRKREWLYTSRSEVDRRDTLPKHAVWVFSGTNDGNALAAAIASRGCPVVVSTATRYGGELAAVRCPGVHVWAGRQGAEARGRALADARALVLVDATHPYAQAISEQLIGLARTLALPYLRYERPSLVDPQASELCASAEAAAARAIALGERIFLATGSKALPLFLRHDRAAARQWFVRLIPAPDLLQRAIDLGVPRNHICAMQGPFSAAFNEALWRDWQIDCVVTKDSGDAGGHRDKAAAAAALGIPLLVIKRPAVAYPFVTGTFDGALRQLAAWGIAP